MKLLEVRARLVAALEADLVGPFVPDDHAQGGQEALPLAPSRWYLTGFLAPQGGRAPEADDQDSVEEGVGAGSETQAEDAGGEEPEAKRPVRFPASMGLSVFLPEGQGDAVEVDAWYAGLRQGRGRDRAERSAGERLEERAARAGARVGAARCGSWIRSTRVRPCSALLPFPLLPIDVNAVLDVVPAVELR